MAARRGPRARTDNSVKYEIEGLKDFVRALGEVADKYPKQVGKANYELATTVRKNAQSRARRWGGVVEKGSRSLREGRSQYNASILGGAAGSASDRAVFFGAEFGGLRKTRGKKLPGGGRGAPKQKFCFRPWRGNQFGGWNGGPGYFLFPTIREDGPHLIEEYKEMLERLEDQAFPD